jgi:hypothetical protein
MSETLADGIFGGAPGVETWASRKALEKPDIFAETIQAHAFEWMYTVRATTGGRMSKENL